MDACDTIELDDECWLDVHRGWVEDDGGLFDEVFSEAQWDQEEILLFGRPVLQPRLTAWFGVGMDAATRYRTQRPAAPWSPRMASLRDRLIAHTGVDFNSALANLYRGGQDSVGWHADDEPALGLDPVIASVSLGDARRFRLRSRADNTKTVNVSLGAGDLLVMHGATQRLWLHSVPKVARAGERINLTFRAYAVSGAAKGLSGSFGGGLPDGDDARHGGVDDDRAG